MSAIPSPLSHLDSNNLQGPLTDIFTPLVSVQALSLYNNTLVGAVPNSILDLPNLDDVDLRSNHLDGAVPNFLINYDMGGSCLLYDNDFSCHLDTGTGCVTDNVPECTGTVNGTVYTVDAAGLSRGAIAGIAVSGVLAFSTILGLVAFMYYRKNKQRRRDRSGFVELPSYSATVGKMNPQDVKAIDGSDGPWWTRSDVKVDPATLDANSNATSNVRRYPFDGAYPGMPGFQHSESEVPAIAMNTPELGVNSTRPRRASDSAASAFSASNLQLNNPIVRGSVEDGSPNDLDEAGARKAPSDPGATSFFGRLFGGASTGAAPVPSEEEDADTLDELPAGGEVSAADAKSLYSHQGAFAAASAKRAAAAKAKASKKGRVPTVTKARGPSV
ncbi:hypothetical protein HK405_000532 [Cladochytrium tenue]|nr:hypothetical protein HK405_000532 [Cladochytrium tenue]